MARKEYQPYEGYKNMWRTGWRYIGVINQTATARGDGDGEAAVPRRGGTVTTLCINIAFVSPDTLTRTNYSYKVGCTSAYEYMNKTSPQIKVDYIFRLSACCFNDIVKIVGQI